MIILTLTCQNKMHSYKNYYKSFILGQRLSAGCGMCMSSEEKALLLKLNLRVQCLISLNCDDSAWASAMLRKYLPHVEELQLFNPTSHHLRLIQKYQNLKRLEIRGWHEELDSSPFMFSPTTYCNQKLSHISVELPKETTRSLLFAHRASVKTVKIFVEPPSHGNGTDEWPKSCNDLPDVLARCQFLCLEEIYFMHMKLGHRSRECEALLKEVRRILQPNVKIQCRLLNF